MFELLRDPIWQFIGAVLALIGIAVTIYLFYKQTQNKALSYKFITRTPLLTVDEEIKGDVQVLFRGEQVQDVYLVVIKVWNAGNVPIIPSDYIEPFGLHFVGQARIISAEVIEALPRSLEPDFRIDPDKITFSPILLNSKDAFVLKFLVAFSLEGYALPFGRIVGVREISSLHFSLRQAYASIFVGILICLSAFLIGARYFLLNPGANDLYSKLIAGVVLLLGVLGFVVMQWPGLRSSYERQKDEEYIEKHARNRQQKPVKTKPRLPIPAPQTLAPDRVEDDPQQIRREEP